MSLPPSGPLAGAAHQRTGDSECRACRSAGRQLEGTCECCTRGLTPAQVGLARRPTVLRVLSLGDPATIEIVVRAPEIVTMGDLIAHVLSAHLWWPHDFVEFVVLQEVFVHHPRLAARSCRLLRTLDCDNGGELQVAILVRPPPDVFPYTGRDGARVFACMCSFGECCRYGRAGRCSHLSGTVNGYCRSCGKPPGSLCSRCGNPCQVRPQMPHLAECRQCCASEVCLTRRVQGRTH